MDLLTAVLVTLGIGIGLYLLQKAGIMEAKIMDISVIIGVIIVILVWCSFFGVFDYLRGVHVGRLR